MEEGKRTRRRHLEHGASATSVCVPCPTAPCRTVKVAVCSLDQASFREGAFTACEGVEGREHARGRQLEDRALARDAATNKGCAVQGAVFCPEQPGDRFLAFRIGGSGPVECSILEGMKDC